MNKKSFTTYSNNGLIEYGFVSEIDENTVKSLNLEQEMSIYEQCLEDEKYLSDYILKKQLQGMQDKGEDSKKMEEFKIDWDNKFKQIKDEATEIIKNHMEQIKECSVPIHERRKKVTEYISRIKQTLIASGCIRKDGRIKQIGDKIDNEIFIDIYYLLADAICCRFQLNQFDSKYREGLYHCLQYLDYRFWHNDFSKQYPDATEEGQESLRRTNLLDIVTGRDNAEIDVQGQKYKCSAYIEDRELFRIKIEEAVPWNISNAPKENFTLDYKKHELLSVDERYTVKLNATQMTYYVFVYENADMDIKTMLNNKDAFKDVSEKCSCEARQLTKCFKEFYEANDAQKPKVEKEFKVEFNKRISEINKKVRIKLGEAYTIMIEEGKYYIPISKNQTNKPEN